MIKRLREKSDYRYQLTWPREVMTPRAKRKREMALYILPLVICSVGRDRQDGDNMDGEILLEGVVFIVRKVVSYR